MKEEQADKIILGGIQRPTSKRKYDNNKNINKLKKFLNVHAQSDNKFLQNILKRP